MLASGIPRKYPFPWASSAGGSYITQTPLTSQIGVPGQDGRASLPDGFVPLNFDPVASGGIPPFGDDHNGILNWITQNQQWTQAGAPWFFDATFSSEIGGYPKGAHLKAANYPGVEWVSLSDNNTTNPDTGPSNAWLGVGTAYYAYNSGPVSLTYQHNDAVITLTGGGFTCNLPDPRNAAGVRFDIVMSGSETAVTLTTPYGYIWGYGTGSASVSLPNPPGPRLHRASSDGTNWLLVALPAFAPGGDLQVDRNLSVLGAAYLGAGALGSGDPTRVVRLGDFTSTWLAINDAWSRLPDGRIHQVIASGVPYAAGVTATTLVTLPITFPGNINWATGCYSGNSPNPNVAVSFQPASPSQVAVSTYSFSGSGTAGVVIEAGGY